jgi:DNA gyrase inhibitor GyrI
MQFPCGSPDGLDDMCNKIFLKWLPDSRENFDDARPFFCEYFNMECIKTNPEKLITKLYVPLQ